MAEGAGFEPAWDCSQTDFESLSMSFHWYHVGAFGCRWERVKWRSGAGLRAVGGAVRGFGENEGKSKFSGYLLARC